MSLASHVQKIFQTNELPPPARPAPRITGLDPTNIQDASHSFTPHWKGNVYSQDRLITKQIREE